MLIPRFTALFLTLALCLPSPAHALRGMQALEDSAGLEELDAFLREGRPLAGRAGLEESGASVEERLRAFLRVFVRLSFLFPLSGQGDSRLLPDIVRSDTRIADNLDKIGLQPDRVLYLIRGSDSFVPPTLRPSEVGLIQAGPLLIGSLLQQREQGLPIQDLDYVRVVRAFDQDAAAHPAMASMAGIRLSSLTDQEIIGFLQRIREVAGWTSAAGLEEPALPEDYRRGVENVSAAMRRLGVQTPLTPGEVWTLAQWTDSQGHLVAVPMDQPIGAWVPEYYPGQDPVKAADLYRIVTALPLLEAARRRDQDVALLAGPSLLGSVMFRSLREGRISPSLEEVKVPPEAASLVHGVPLLAQAEDPEAPRWRPAQTKTPPRRALELGASGYKAGVLLGVKLPGRAYHDYWDWLAGRNIDWVREQAELVRHETGGRGLGLMATALIYAAPPRDYVPVSSDAPRDVWEKFTENLGRQGHSMAELEQELQRDAPAEWAVAAQTAIWLKSPLKRELEATEDFARAHQEMTDRFAESWGRTPGITLIMAGGPYFVSTLEQWRERKDKAVEAVRDLKERLGGSGKWVLLSRNRAPSVYKAELAAMMREGVAVGASAGRTLIQPTLQNAPRPGERRFYHPLHPYFLGATKASARNLNQVLNVLDRYPADVWQSYGITPEQAAGLVAAARLKPAAGLEEGLVRAAERLVRQPGFLRTIRERGGELALDPQSLPGAPSGVRWSGGALMLLDSASPEENTLVLSAQRGIDRERLNQLGAVVFDLPDEVGEAVKKLGDLQAAYRKDLALFNRSLDGVSAEAVQAQLSAAFVAPPRALLLLPGQESQLTRRQLNDFASSENLPPVIVLVVAARIQDGAGNTYALAFWA